MKFYCCHPVLDTGTSVFNNLHIYTNLIWIPTSVGMTFCGVSVKIIIERIIYMEKLQKYQTKAVDNCATGGGLE